MSTVLVAITSSITGALGTSKIGRKLEILGNKEKAALFNLVSLKAGIDNVKAKIHLVDNKLAQTQEQLNLYNARIKEAEGKLNHKRAVLNRRVKAIYKSGDNVSLLQTLLEAKSFLELISKYNFLELVSRNDAALVKSIENVRTNLIQYTVSLKQKKSFLKNLRQDVSQSYQTLSEKVKGQKDVLENVKKQKLDLETLNKQASDITSKMQIYGYSPLPVSRIITVEATGYAADSASDNGGWVGQTSTGMPAGKGVVAVSRDPSKRVLPLGTKIYVVGYGRAIVGDVGSGVNANQIDLGFNTSSEAWAWGRQTTRVVVYK